MNGQGAGHAIKNQTRLSDDPVIVHAPDTGLAPVGAGNGTSLIPPFRERSVSIDVRRIRNRPQLSTAANLAIMFGLWAAPSIIGPFLPSPFAAKTMAIGSSLFWAVSVIALVGITIAAAPCRMIIDTGGQGLLIRKRPWQRPHDRHIVALFDPRTIEFSTNDPWWRAATCSLDGVIYALFTSRAVRNRFRSLVSETGNSTSTVAQDCSTSN